MEYLWFVWFIWILILVLDLFSNVNDDEKTIDVRMTTKCERSSVRVRRIKAMKKRKENKR